MKMNMTPRAKKLLAGLTAAALTLSMLPATALAAKDYATGGETALRFSNSGITVQEGDYDGYKIDGTELTLNIDAPVNDAVNAEQQLNIESGSLTISAGDDALHCDLSLTVGASGTAGPDIDITGCYEGIEAANLAIRSGDIDITATDDCLNAANSDLTGYSFTMDISGSTINAYTSGGDGFDSNGSLTISGGVIAVWTANTADNQPLDADGTITVSGGTVLAAGGSSGMGMNLSASQPYVLYGSTGGMGGGRGQGQQSALAAKGSTLTIQDASGNSVYSAAAPCNVNFAFFSSPKLTLGSSYTLTGGSTTTTATAQTGTTTSSQPGGGQRPDGTGSGTGGQRPSAPADGQQPTPPDGTQQHYAP